MLNAALNGGFSASERRRMIEDAERRTRPMTILKPARRLGATWIDDFVAQRRAVSLCPECAKRYGDWHVRSRYHLREKAELTDCDGCSQTLQVCNSYYAAIM